MVSEDNLPFKVNGSNTSSSAVNSPVEGVRALNKTDGPESLQEFLKSFPKKDLSNASLDNDSKHSGPSRCKIVEKNLSGIKKCKTLESKKTPSVSSSFTDIHALKRQSRKGEHPVRVPSTADAPQLVSSKTLICKNTACKAVLALEDTFCKRCSCCICHMFDDNKDPSLWLVCASESGSSDSCGLSCHIECALQQHKVGVVNLGQSIELDGSYCCASCGKVSGIIRCWKKQLVIAKDARRVDILCYRLSLSNRLLDGTSRFKELHQIVGEAKAKLEAEVGAINGVSAKMARGIVSRLSIAGEVQKLCSLAVEKADEWLNSISAPNSIRREDSLPAACKFQFEDVTSSSLVIVLKDACSSPLSSIKGYKLWYCKSRDDPQENDPVVLSKPRRRILISNLQPCTEYTFRIISFTDTGDFGHSESKCFTKSVEIISKSCSEKLEPVGGSCSGKRKARHHSRSSGFRVRNLGRILRKAWAEEHGDIDGFCSDGTDEENCGWTNVVKSETAEEDQAQTLVSRVLDLNAVSVPDLNADITPLSESSPDEDNGCTSEQKRRPLRSNRSADYETWAGGQAGEVPAVESRSGTIRKQVVSMTEDGASTLINGSPLRFANGSAGRLDDNYEYCVKVIRWLECRGFIEKDFRMKFLTWFSLRSSEQERRVVYTFINTLVDDPSSLAGQLVDSFLEIIACKRPRNGFCSKLWH